MKHVDHQIQAYCDGELGPALRADFEAHLRDCAACRQELTVAQRLWATVDAAAAAAAEPGQDAWPAVAEAIAERRRPAPWSWAQRGLAAAAMAAGVAVGFGLGARDSAQPRTDETTTASLDYLEESLPSLDQVWLQLGDSSEDSGS
jgi:anti-sigma factor RsiW